MRIPASVRVSWTELEGHIPQLGMSLAGYAHFRRLRVSQSSPYERGEPFGALGDVSTHELELGNKVRTRKTVSRKYQ
jgi:hypothetical protein